MERCMLTVGVLALWLAGMAATAAEDLTVALPPGETPLDDIGIYQVGYQSYDGPEMLMPVSWAGHFTDPSGISYRPNDSLSGRRALLIHSPWRVLAGKTWVDYRLKLPNLKPVSLSFGVAMGPDVVTPGRSDGVTFSAYLTHGGRTDELFREHQATAEWHDHSFDLSAYAGQTVVVRLQVEPGPANSPSFDYSYFGDAKIVAGDATGSRRALLDLLLKSKAQRASAGASLAKLANRPGPGVTPSNLLPYVNTAELPRPGFAFVYEGKDARIVYQYQPMTGTLDDLSVAVDGGRPFRPAASGCVTASVKAGDREEQVRLERGRLVEVVTSKPLRVEFTYEYDARGQPVQVTWRLGLLGKALTIEVSCETPIVSAFSLGHVAGAALRRNLGIPYLPPVWGGGGAVSYLPAENLFVGRYLDWTHSNSSSCPQGEATYEPKTDGARNPLAELGYIAVSPNVNEVLPNVPFEPSPYLKLLGDRIMLDIWGHHQNTYAGDAANLRDLKDNGVDHVAIIQHVWQRWGYDVKLPDHLPANPDFGGDAGMVEFGQAANECGYVWSVHENYIDLYPDAPSYDATARVIGASGQPSPAWFNAGTGVQSFGLKCTRALGYAKQNSPTIHDTYKTTAAYLDVHTCVPPWHQLDHEADQPGAATARTKVERDGELFQYMRDTHQGPLFGEGANHFYWAGKCDGVEAQVGGGEDHAPFLDLDLLKLHPQMVNHGMGYYERWFRQGYNHAFGVSTGTPEQIDKYRAQELAYGHAGFIGSQSVDNIQWVAKEHHLMHAVQRLYGTAKATEISYEVEGKLVPGSIALAMGETWRQRIKYDSGLTFWVNWRPEPWKVESRTLPQWGFLARGPNTLVYTGMVGGKLGDYAECPEYLFADARTYFEMPYLQGRKDIEPRLRDFADLGDGKIRVTYEWLINDTLDDDYGCFVHFLNDAATRNDQIVFQGDHAPPTPTSQWRQGQTLVDGPYEITVPGDFDQYRLVIGLHKGGRVSLKGPQESGGRVLIGALNVTRDAEGKVTAVTLGDLKETVDRHAVKGADFTAHMNPPGTTLDFGKIATDGSVKVNKGPRSLTVFPYPRNREFTVALNLKAILPRTKVEAAKLRVRAQAAGTKADMGVVQHGYRDGKLTFQAGQAGAGRFVVTW